MAHSHLTNLELPQLLKRWLVSAVEAEASDLHLAADFPPTLRLYAALRDLNEPAIDADQLTALLEQFCPEPLRDTLRTNRSVDFAFAHLIGGQIIRFRTNLFYAAGSLGACFRVIPAKIPDFGWADFPVSLAKRLAACRDGMVILTGPTGSGKTTTLAMVVNLINQAGGQRIVSIEEPLEFLFPHVPNSVVSQREVGIDVPNFAEGLKNALRQDPDVILVGEIRDRETAQIALSASETGHLVFTTLHSRDAKGAITRYTDLFPNENQRDIRSQLALGLRAIVAQRLLPDVNPANKCHLALEVLWVTYPIASAIRSGKFESIDNYLVTGSQDGMISFDESIRELLASAKVSKHVAELFVRDPLILSR